MPARSLRVFVFGVFAGAIATLTHWPRLSVQSPLPRTDLAVHFPAFAIWTFLLIAAEPFGRFASRANLVKSTLVALLYTVVDELTQGLPILHRKIDPADIAANASGAAFGAFTAWLVGRLAFARAQR